MTALGQALARGHQQDQIANGGLASALVLAIGKEYRGGKLSQDEFVAALMAQSKLSHDAATQIAVKFINSYRGLEAADESHADPLLAEWDAGRAYGRASGVAHDLEELDTDTRDYDAEFWKIINNLAVWANRSALNGGRQTVEFSAAANGKRWRRITDGNPCSFCAMLATRSDYRTKESALRVVGRSTGYGTASYRNTGQVRSTGRARGSKSLGSKFHDYCGCSAVEVLSEWEMSPTEQAQHDLYQQARQACIKAGITASTENILAKMRELGDGIIHDAHTPETQTGGAGGGDGSRRPPRQTAAEPPSWDDRIKEPGLTPGQVEVPAALRVEEHEIATAERLARLGPDIVFLERTEVEGGKNPDVAIDGIVWEFKSPKGSSEKSTIDSQFKRGRKQSENVVIDLARCGLPDELALAQISRRFHGQKRIKQMLIIDHQGLVTYLTK